MSKFTVTVESDDSQKLANILILADVILHEGALEPHLDQLLVALEWLLLQVTDLPCLTWEENQEDVEKLICCQETFAKHLHKIREGEHAP